MIPTEAQKEAQRQFTSKIRRDIVVALIYILGAYAIAIIREQLAYTSEAQANNLELGGSLFLMVLMILLLIQVVGGFYQDIRQKNLLQDMIDFVMDRGSKTRTQVPLAAVSPLPPSAPAVSVSSPPTAVQPDQTLARPAESPVQMPTHEAPGQSEVGTAKPTPTNPTTNSTVSGTGNSGGASKHKTDKTTGSKSGSERKR